MSKYKEGDKVVMEITNRFKNAYDHEYYSVLDSLYSTEFIDEKSEPLGNYTEPLEAKIRRQVAEITRLLRENAELKEESKRNYTINIEMARAEGRSEAWELARKIAVIPKDGGYGGSKLIKIFNTALLNEIFNLTYSEAAAKVAQWEKAKEEIKVGDVVKCEGSYGVITEIGTSTFSGIRKDSTVFHWYKVNCTKTGRHIDMDSFLKQIGEE